MQVGDIVFESTLRPYRLVVMAIDPYMQLSWQRHLWHDDIDHETYVVCTVLPADVLLDFVSHAMADRTLYDRVAGITEGSVDG